MTTTEHRIRFKEVHLVPKDQATTGEDAMFDDDTTTKRTLGGVSREPRSAAFVPAVKSGKKPLFQGPKQKRRWHKRPEGYNTDDEKAGEQSKKTKKRTAKRGTADEASAVDPEAGGNEEMADSTAPAAEQQDDSEEDEEVNEDEEMMSQDAEGSEVE